MQRNFFCILIITCVVLSCSSNKYAVTNRSYKRQAKAFGKVISHTPKRDVYNEKAGWVGTTNFGLRKPDFVIIFPWNIKDEVSSQLSYIRDWGGRFVTAIPALEIF